MGITTVLKHSAVRLDHLRATAGKERERVMFSENTVKTPRRWNNSEVVMCLLLLMVGASPAVRAQEAPNSAEDIQVRRKAELHTRAKGKVIAEGKNKNVSEQVPVERYTVEELNLEAPVEVEIGGEKKAVYQAYRLTVFGGPFKVRSMAPLLYIDDNPPLVGVEGRDLDRVTFILYDGSLLREGATLTVGYGVGNIELTDKFKHK
jgi:hypothetical protein